MKARKALQITLGALCIVSVALAVLVAVSVVITHQLAPESDATIFQNVNQAIRQVSDWLQLGMRNTLISLLLMPMLMLTLAAILLLTLAKDNEGKTIAGCVFALLGSAILYGFDVCVGFCMATKYALTVILPSVVMLFVMILFSGLTLGIKNRKSKQAYSTEQTTESDEQTLAETTEVESVERETETTAEQNTTAEAETATQNSEIAGDETQEAESLQTAEQEYTPVESESETAAEDYGNRQSESVNNHKLATLKMLFDSGAITQEEYEKLLEQYTK